ncbi:MAG: hypothetical protein JW841_05890 [Deltaproteobacteria bacterium]|nr:hypothetical protein [Deltaproteobacteria bacterium]
MEEKKLESFKISDTRKPSVRSPKKAEQVELPTESPTLGFKRIEGMLEREDSESVKANLEELKNNLNELAINATSHKEKANAKKAIMAVDRTTALVNFLYETRESLINSTLAE